MLTALKGMQNDKSPGIDGLPTEFYKFFWKGIKDYLYKYHRASLIKEFLVYHSKEELLPSYLKKLKMLRKSIIGDQYHS